MASKNHHVDADPANAALQAGSPMRGIAANVDAVATALGVNVREIYRRLWPAALPRHLGCAVFPTSASGHLLPITSAPGLAGYRFPVA